LPVAPVSRVPAGHNERVRPPLNRMPLAVLVTGASCALVLAGCSSGNGDNGSSSSGSSSPSPSSTVKVPSSVKLTDQGSKLSYGDSATVIYEPSKGRGSVLKLTVKRVQQGTLKDFAGFILDDAYKRKANYYYALVRVKNVGEGNVGGVPVPLWGVNEKNILLPAVNFTTSFEKCPSKPLPKHFGSGKALSTCLVYLAPNHGKLVGVSYRPSQEFNPITWSGTVAKPPPPKKTEKPKKSAKKSEKKKSKKKQGQ
jgi:hypothetical protein